ncbi:MAG TPA: hypothetical protein VGN15_00500 [Ktedonobacteraceae bacterium]|jgi:hypothetical protein|nr:hypothetical protein [Ktedonobacteraceae bacterium]
MTEQQNLPATATKSTLTIDRHPAYESILTWINYGTVEFNGELIEQAKDLVEVVNQNYPDYNISPAALTRLKKRIIRERGGYTLKDGRLARQDGSVIQVVGIAEALESIAHMGIEYLLNNPYKIKAEDVIKALTLLRDIRKETEESDEFGQAWVDFYKNGRKRKMKVVNVTPTMPEKNDLEEDLCEDLEPASSL